MNEVSCRLQNRRYDIVYHLLINYTVLCSGAGAPRQLSLQSTVSTIKAICFAKTTEQRWLLPVSLYRFVIGF